ncbi:MAG TPA: cupredoxin domain-containing protein [Acidimicrobiia bacterium]|nr:cupredoxin domain-containing protein [Acidimicrobiia bacterium]
MAAVAVILLGSALAACSSDDDTDVSGAGDVTTTEATEATSPAARELGESQYVKNATEFVDAADWDAATTVTVELGEMYFKPSGLTFEAGKAYKLEMVNAGEEKHEFAAEDFARGTAFRKAEDADSEVKVPFFREIEVFAGKTTEVLFVAVMPGTYEMFCEIEGHREKGMEGTITVTGEPPTSPAPVLGELADGAWVQDGPARVDAANWDAMTTVRIELGEMYFKPKDIALTVGTPYKLELVNAGDEKHEVVAEDFFTTIAFRKAEDSVGEYKGPTVREAEVFAGKQLDLYVIPTKAGSFLLVCEIEGHREKGMDGTITVSAS